jgi:hypothetical protein
MVAFPTVTGADEVRILYSGIYSLKKYEDMMINKEQIQTILDDIIDYGNEVSRAENTIFLVKQRIADHAIRGE